MDLLVMHHWITLERWALGGMSLDVLIERQCNLALDLVRAHVSPPGKANGHEPSPTRAHR
jgi:hypothetical protein